MYSCSPCTTDAPTSCVSCTLVLSITPCYSSVLYTGPPMYRVSLLTCRYHSLSCSSLAVAVRHLLRIGWLRWWGVLKYGIHPVYLRARACVLGHRGHIRPSGPPPRSRMAPSVGVLPSRDVVTPLLRTSFRASATQELPFRSPELPRDHVHAIMWS